MPAPQSFLLAGLFGLLGFFLIGIVCGFANVFLMAQVFGQRGLENVGAIAVMPVLALVLGALWLALDWFLTRRSGPTSPGRAALYGGLLGLVLGLLMAGPRGFTPTGGSALFNYFTIAIGATGAWLHRLLARSTAS